MPWLAWLLDLCLPSKFGGAAESILRATRLIVIVLSNQLAHLPRRPLFVPGSAEVRGSVKAARFRTAFVQLRALRVSSLRSGQLVTVPLFRLGLRTGIEAAIGAGS
jgi:hypothetical protein